MPYTLAFYCLLRCVDPGCSKCSQILASEGLYCTFFGPVQYFIRLRMFMQIHIFISTVHERELKQKFRSSICYHIECQVVTIEIVLNNVAILIFS